MEPVAVLRGRRRREVDIDWDMCFICQINTEETPHQATEIGIWRIKKCASKRLKYHDQEFLNTLDSTPACNMEAQIMLLSVHPWKPY